MSVAAVWFAVLLALAPGLRSAAAADAGGLGRAIATKLHAARQGIHPNTHATDFASDHIGCITLTRGEMRRLGYPGHAFACEEATAAEVLGGVLNRRGVVICHISGAYVGDGCYDLDVCETRDTLCVQ